MPKTPYDIDYSKLYPGVDIPDKVLEVLKKSDRKMKYMELDLKQEKPIKDEDGVVISLAPSREDSLDRLLELDKQFPDDGDLTEQVLQQIDAEALHRALALLTDDERALINALFFEGLTEQEYGTKISLTQQAVNKRRQKILSRLKKLLDI